MVWSHWHITRFVKEIDDEKKGLVANCFAFALMYGNLEYQYRRSLIYEDDHVKTILGPDYQPGLIHNTNALKAFNVIAYFIFMTFPPLQARILDNTYGAYLYGH